MPDTASRTTEDATVFPMSESYLLTETVGDSDTCSAAGVSSFEDWGLFTESDITELYRSPQGDLIMSAQLQMPFEPALVISTQVKKLFTEDPVVSILEQTHVDYWEIVNRQISYTKNVPYITSVLMRKLKLYYYASCLVSDLMIPDNPPLDTDHHLSRSNSPTNSSPRLRRVHKNPGFIFVSTHSNTATRPQTLLSKSQFTEFEKALDPLDVFEFGRAQDNFLSTLEVLRRLGEREESITALEREKTPLIGDAVQRRIISCEGIYSPLRLVHYRIDLGYPDGRQFTFVCLHDIHRRNSAEQHLKLQEKLLNEAEQKSQIDQGRPNRQVQKKVIFCG